jgi:tetratricopeptide (TPR) repeat protein
MRQRRFDEAMLSFREAVQLAPSAVGSWNNLGLLLLEQMRLGEALEAFKSAVAAQPQDVEALTNLGQTLCRVGLLDKAEYFLGAALQLAPRHADAHHYLGYLLKLQKREEEAERHLATALEIVPGSAGYLSTLGLLREQQQRGEEATALFQQAVKANPSVPAAWNNLGNVQGAIWGNYDLALHCFNQTLALNSHYSEARFHRGMVELVCGDFSQGWADYEYRPTNLNKSRERYDRPRWQGEELQGKTILLHCEQGLGDTLQFIRYAQQVQALGATVICEVQKVLLALLRRTPGIDVLIGEGDVLPAHDVQIPLLSVARILGIREAQPPYFLAEPERMELWRSRIAKIPGFKIGIAWQGEPNFKYDWLRSVPLKEFTPLARVPGCSLISLQKYRGVEQIEANRTDVPVIVLEPPIDAEGGAFLDTAAIMQHLDLVITSDSAMAHLAGGLGVPVWLATQYAPDWRWLTRREDSPWYPTMRLFRQTKVGQWEDVFQRMAGEMVRRLVSPDH